MRIMGHRLWRRPHRGGPCRTPPDSWPDRLFDQEPEAGGGPGGAGRPGPAAGGPGAGDGLSRNMDGTLGPRAEKYAAFARRLEEATGLPVALWTKGAGPRWTPTGS